VLLFGQEKGGRSLHWWSMRRTQDYDV